MGCSVSWIFALTDQRLAGEDSISCIAEAAYLARAVSATCSVRELPTGWSAGAEQPRGMSCTSVWRWRHGEQNPLPQRRLCLSPATGCEPHSMIKKAPYVRGGCRQLSQHLGGPQVWLPSVPQQILKSYKTDIRFASYLVAINPSSYIS